MKRMKKLIAALMAVAMIASLNISAFAQQPAATTPPTAPTKYTATGDFGQADGTNDDTAVSIGTATGSSASSATATNDHAKGTVSGEIYSEGKEPENIVNMIMPVIPTSNTAASPFDMILDPHNLIGRSITSGAQRVTGMTANDSLVYFTNLTPTTASGKTTYAATATYSATSDNLTVTNKGYWDVDVKLTAEVSKGVKESAGSQIAFVNSTSALASATGPAMYMAVQTSDSKVGAVADSYAVPELKVYNSTGVAGSSLFLVDPVFKYADGVLTREKRQLNAVLGTADSTASPAILPWGLKLVTATGNATSGAKLSASFGTYQVSGNTVTFTDTANTATATNNDGEVLVSGTYNVLAKEGATTAMAKDTNVLTIKGTDANNTIEVKIPVQFKSSAAGATAKTIGTITMKIDPVVLSASTATTAYVVFGKSTATSSGTASTTIAGLGDTGYQLKYDATKKYYKELLSGLEGNSLNFNLTAAINNSDGWDDMNTASDHAKVNGLTTKVIWDVKSQYDTVAPTVKTTRYAVNAKDEARFVVNFGKATTPYIGVAYLKIGTTTYYPSTPVYSTANPPVNNSSTILNASSAIGVNATGVNTYTAAGDAKTAGTIYSIVLDSVTTTTGKLYLIDSNGDVMTDAKAITVTLVNTDA